MTNYVIELTDFAINQEVAGMKSATINEEKYFFCMKYDILAFMVKNMDLELRLEEVKGDRCFYTLWNSKTGNWWKFITPYVGKECE